MPTWKSPVSAASLPSRIRSYVVPAASWARTTSAMAAATSAGPYDVGVRLDQAAPVQPTASASRSCSTESSEPMVKTVASPPVALAAWIGSSTAHSSCGLTV